MIRLEIPSFRLKFLDIISIYFIAMQKFDTQNWSIKTAVEECENNFVSLNTLLPFKGLLPGIKPKSEILE